AGRGRAAGGRWQGPRAAEAAGACGSSCRRRARPPVRGAPPLPVVGGTPLEDDEGALAREDDIEAGASRRGPQGGGEQRRGAGPGGAPARGNPLEDRAPPGGPRQPPRRSEGGRGRQRV